MSPPQISITFTPEAQAVLQRLEKLPRAVLGVIARAVDQQNLLTVSFIQQKHLSFPKTGPATMEGLRHQSGDYRRTTRASKCRISGQSVVSSIGTQVKYARVHEFGFSGSVQVPQHERKIIVGTGTQTVTTKSGRQYKKKVVIGGTTTVKAHSRKMNLPARRPILRGIAANLDAYTVRVSDAIVKLANGGNAT